MLKRLRVAPLHLKLLGGFALVLAFSAAQSGLACWTTLTRKIESDAAVVRTEQVLHLESETQTALLKMEAAYQGFLFLGDEALLGQYTADAQLYSADLAALEQLTAEDPAQVARWRDLGQRQAVWQQQVVDQGVTARRAASVQIGPNTEAIRASAQRGVALQYVPQMQLILDSAIHLEQDLLTQRLHVNRALSDQLTTVLLGGIVLRLGVGAIVAIWFSRRLASALHQVSAAAEEHEISERRYRQMFENNEAVKLLVDPNGGIIVDANAAACTFYGYPPKGLVGR
ncbi:MAG TPA: CHASE3 domain-containing protein, partial [Chloroflexota bacterium]|nr:CHASE3 domain-containing protein [Chloroflexota bacterium]